MSITATCLTDALIQILRANSAVATAFGDTWNGTTGDIKFFADWADQVAYPYLVLDEVQELYERNTLTAEGTSFIATGVIMCPIWQSGRSAAKALATLVCNALNNCDKTAEDGPITWSDFNGTCELMDFYMSKASFDPNPNVGPGAPSTFNRVVTFNYTYQGIA